MATYVADVPVNLTFRSGAGSVDLARGDRYGREPIPAGEPFEIENEALAQDFELAMGPQPNAANLSSAGRAGRIPGLRRVG